LAGHFIGVDEEHAPVPLQVPTATAMSSAHVPPQAVPCVASRDWQTPSPSQESGSVHASSIALPHFVLIGMSLGLQLPEPSQVSGAEHSVATI